MHAHSFSLEPKIVKKINTKNRLIQTAIPCKGTKEILKRLEIVESRSMHGQLPIIWEKAKDFNVYDPAGNCWIDFTSTIFVANIGHSNQKLSNALKKTIESPLLNCYAYSNRTRADYLEKLIKFAGDNFQNFFVISRDRSSQKLHLN